MTARELMVRGLVLEADGVLTVDLADPSGAPLPEWEPGAHVDLVVGDGTVRQYSICGRPGTLTVAVRHDPAGRGGSSWVHRTLRPGDPVTLRGVKNHFALEDAAEIVLIAGGVGITPLLPMAERLAAGDRPWRLVYVGRAAAGMPFLDRVRALGGAVTVHETATGGRPDLARHLEEPGLVYVCGPATLIDAVSAALEARGEADRLRAEYFQAPETLTTDDGSFTIKLEKSGVELVVPADKSALEVVNDAGLDVLSDCEEGICGSCETRVLAGEVDHRDYVLTAAEKAANRCMMLCVSRALGQRITIDL
ncbi:PDR/VanB family oxidoreductase [Actinoplanes sp. NBRC 101535]|uniref:PDR/VanB family oxidoreductase n=1 Tax=Actinoplanes sp. NBRC 101535 TaxID=3032196 RepID=UPI0024A1C5DB|nr:PDR/VanB family oxidoreductase [Actinoplanes sp. NBRC 101535]GLY04432.1 ferredoxin [Actinoplanes sp. NBRC 101535]